MKMAKLSLAWGIALSAVVVQAAYEDMPDPGKWSLSTDGELITLKANEVPIRKVMEVINDFTPAEIDIDRLPDENITVRYYNIMLDELLVKMNVSFVLTYSERADGGGYELESAWVSQYKRQSGAGSTSGAAGSGGGVTPSALAPNALRAALGYQTDTDYTNDVGTLYRVPFPLTMKLDGNLNEWPADIPWHQVDHTMGTGLATNDADASMQFASAADNDHVYVAVQIKDDERVLNRDEATDTANEDSIALNIGNEKLSIRRQQVWKLNAKGVAQPVSHQFIALESGSRAVIVERNDGWYVEVSIPYEAVGLSPGQTNRVPMDILLNDDDDGGARDAQLRWSAAAHGGHGASGFELRRVGP